MNKKEFKKKVHLEAIKFRKRKVKEILEKETPTELELSIIKKWAETYGDEAW